MLPAACPACPACRALAQIPPHSDAGRRRRCCSEPDAAPARRPRRQTPHRDGDDAASLAQPSPPARALRQAAARLRELAAAHADPAADAAARVPMAVVLGVQSAGKSALLERLAGLAVFPRGRGPCTRAPVRLCLRRGPAGGEAVLFERRVASDGDAWPAGDVAAGAGGGEPLALERVGERVRERMAALAAGAELVVVVRGPALPDADVVDLPGLVAASREAGEALARRYAAAAGLVLVVHPATMGAAVDLALHLAANDCA